MKIVHTADIHLHPHRGESLDGGADRLEDGLATTRESLELARSLGALWLFTGDLKMPRRTWVQDALNGALHLFETYDDVPKLLLKGNHDHQGLYGSGLLPLMDHTKTHVIERPSIFRGVSHGFLGVDPLACWPAESDWTGYDAFRAQAWADGARILIGHLFLLGSLLGAEEVRLPGVGHRVEALGIGPIPAPDVPFQLGLFGDIHKAQMYIVRPGATWRPLVEAVPTPDEAVPLVPGTALYPGSPYAQNWGERGDGPKGCLVIDTDAGTLTRHVLQAPAFILADWREKPGDAAELRTWTGNFVRLMVAKDPGEAWVTKIREKVKPRTFRVDVMRPAIATTRAPAMHAGLSPAQLIEAYVEARPLDTVKADLVVQAGKRLLGDDA